MLEKTISLHIRVPEGLVQEIRKVARETNTPQGTALKYLIEQARNDQIDKRLIALEETTRKQAKHTNEIFRLLTGYMINDRAKRTLEEISGKGEISESDRKELEDAKELLEKLGKEKTSPCYELVCSALEEY